MVTFKNCNSNPPFTFSILTLLAYVSFIPVYARTFVSVDFIYTCCTVFTRVAQTLIDICHNLKQVHRILRLVLIPEYDLRVTKYSVFEIYSLKSKKNFRISFPDVKLVLIVRVAYIESDFFCFLLFFFAAWLGFFPIDLSQHEKTTFLAQHYLGRWFYNKTLKLSMK